MANYLDRSEALIGKEKLSLIQSKKVLVIGLGGVGGTALEALVRSGFTRLLIADGDEVEESNLNRQILFTKDDVGLNKALVAFRRINSIASDLDVKAFDKFIDESNLDSLFKNEKIDYIIDAIDRVDAKLAILEYALKHNIPVISSMGMGKRLDPTKVYVTTLNKTEGDPLAKKIRYECKQKGLDLTKIKCVCSKETPVDSGNVIASMMMVPSTAGLLIAKEIINDIK